MTPVAIGRYEYHGRGVMFFDVMISAIKSMMNRMIRQMITEAAIAIIPRFMPWIFFGRKRLVVK